MIVDALLAADPVLHMSDSIYNPKEYATLSDGIIREIERSRDPLLEESRVIIKRLRKRDLYRYVDRVILNQAQRSIWGKDDFCKSNYSRELRWQKGRRTIPGLLVLIHA